MNAFANCFTSYDYMCVRVHLIDENWNLKNLALEYYRLEDLEPDEVIEKCFQDFDILKKISGVMVHNTFDELDIINNLSSRIQSVNDRLQINGHIFRVPCCASFFCVMVEEAFEKIEQTVSKMRELHSFGKSLPMWHIKLGNVKATLQMKAEGEYDTDEVKKHYKLPSMEEWKRAGDVCRLVGFIRDASEVFYEAKNATATLYLYNLQKLRAALIKESASSDQFISRLALNMLEKLYGYWKDIFIVLALATVLDPRCKMKYVEFVSLKYEGNSGNSQIELVLEAIHKLYNEYTAQFPVTDDSSVYLRLSSSVSGPDSDFDEEMSEHEQKGRERHADPSFGFDSVDELNYFVQSHHNQAHRSELERYLEEPVLPWNRNIDLLGWWRTASSNYPTLGRMARDLLALPLSLATDYDAYFSDFRPADSEVFGLKPDLKNALICTRSWIQQQQSVSE